jgi:hypothetical protein
MRMSDRLDRADDRLAARRLANALGDVDEAVTLIVKNGLPVAELGAIVPGHVVPSAPRAEIVAIVAGCRSAQGGECMTERERLANRRANETAEFEIGGHRYVATLGRFPDGRPAEIFLNTKRTGSELERTTRDAAVLASLGLQFGIPLEVLRKALSRKPNGDPDSALCFALDELAKQETSQ